ncbi:GlxA family transcriptional regulator [Sulfitobacter aestuarii]|uniref:GlxA family transcriptional regulator n=1 Tax=Sulfitobacter aestuarii TaxID=2161676 RepID=A0ABW5U5N0_9RHOB
MVICRAAQVDLEGAKTAMCSEHNETGGVRAPVIPSGAAYYEIKTDTATREFAFLLLPRFTLLAFSSALDPLRIANQLAQKPLYSWTVYAEDAGPVISSSSISVNADQTLKRFPPRSEVFVCSGTVNADPAHASTLAALRDHVRFGGSVGGICTGAFALAQAGLLNDRKVSLHWENAPVFRERFPELDVSEEIYVIDGKVRTCGGGAAATDLMLKLIEEDHGRDFAELVADMCLTGGVRQSMTRQRASLSHTIGTRNPILTAVLSEMQNNLENPLTMEVMAQEVGASVRQIERLFRKYLNTSPHKYCQNLRLDHAHGLLRGTDLSITEIAMAAGFSSRTLFSRRYKERFGTSPRNMR